MHCFSCDSDGCVSLELHPEAFYSALQIFGSRFGRDGLGSCRVVDISIAYLRARRVVHGLLGTLHLKDRSYSQLRMPYNVFGALGTGCRRKNLLLGLRFY